MATPNTNIFISDLPADVDDDKLKEVFGQYGTVTWSKVMASKGKPTSSAIVEFGDVSEAQWVVENLNGNLAQGISTPLTLTYKRERSKGDGKGKSNGESKGAGGYGKAWTPGGKAWTPGGKAWSPYGKSNGAANDNSGGAATPNKNVFIADLPSDVDDAKLKEVFGQYGTVTWSKVMDSKGKPTSSAIVEFGDVSEAQWVVENLNGNLAQGISTPLTLTFKRERSKGDGKGKSNGESKGAGGYGKAWTPGGKAWTPGGKAWSPSGNSNGDANDNSGGAATPNTNVFIADLPSDVDDAKLKEVFGQYGTVTWSKVMNSKGKPTSSAIVEFGDVSEAQWVVENLNGNLAQGISTPLTLTFKRERSKGDGKGKSGDGKAGKGWSPYGKGAGSW